MRRLLVLAVLAALLSAACGGGNARATGCDDMKKGFAKLNVDAYQLKLLKHISYSATRLYVHRVTGEACLTTQALHASLERAKDDVGDYCAECVSELNRAEDQSG